MRRVCHQVVPFREEILIEPLPFLVEALSGKLRIVYAHDHFRHGGQRMSRAAFSGACSLSLLAALGTYFHLKAEESLPAQRRVDAFGDTLPPHACARLGTVRWRHGGIVYFVAFLPGGSQLLTADLESYDGGKASFHIWDSATGKEVRRFGGVIGDANCIALSADGKRLVEGNGEEVRIWDIGRGQCRKWKLPTSIKAATGGWALDPKGESLFIKMDREREVREIDLQTGRVRGRFSAPATKDFQIVSMSGPRYSSCFAPNAKTIVGIDPEDRKIKEVMGVTTAEAVYRVTVWERSTAKVLQQFGVSSWGPLVFAADGRSLAAVTHGSKSSFLSLFDIRTGKHRQAAQIRSAREIALSFDGAVLAVFANDGGLNLNDLRTGRQRILLTRFPEGTGSYRQLAFSADGRRIAAVLGRRVRIWDVASGQELTDESGPADALLSLVISADGKTVNALGGDKVLSRWDKASGRLRARLSLSDDVDAGGAVFAPDGCSIFFTAGTSLLFDTVSHLLDMVLPDTAAELLALLFEQLSVLESFTYEFLSHQMIQRWDFDSRRMLPAPRKWLTEQASLAVASDGMALAGHTRLADDKKAEHRVYVWDLRTGATRLNLLAGTASHEDEVAIESIALALSPLGRRLALSKNLSVGADNNTGAAVAQEHSIQLLDVATGQTELEFKTGLNRLEKIAFSPNTRLLACFNSNHTISIWERYTGQEVWRQKVAKVSCFAFSPNGRLLATGGSDHVVRLWDLTSFKRVGQFRGHTGQVNALFFTPDGWQLASASADTTVLFWDVNAALKSGLGTMGGVPTPEEVNAALRDLGVDDGAKAYRAMEVLARSPRATIAQLARRVAPAAKPDLARVAEWIRNLDSPRFAERTRAQSELERLGRPAQRSLLAALSKDVSLEKRRRLESLLKNSCVPSGKELFCLRAVDLLERIGTREALAVLRRLADGAPGSPLTEEAQLSVTRLSKVKSP
jgi:WD40 repeat protein